MIQEQELRANRWARARRKAVKELITKGDIVFNKSGSIIFVQYRGVTCTFLYCLTDSPEIRRMKVDQLWSTLVATDVVKVDWDAI